MINWVHPSIFLIAGGLLFPLFKGRNRQFYMVLLPVLSLISVLMMSPGTYGVFGFMDYELVFGEVDRLSLMFATVFTMFAVIGAVYSLHVKEDGHQIAAFFYAGSGLGAVFAGDFFTLFIFWELMAVTSVFLIWYRKGKKAIEAGYRYFLVHTVGGVIFLGGIVLHVVNEGTLKFGELEKGSPGFYLILIGFILNAAVPPLHAWLVDAYPEATITGVIFLNAFTTKTAVYVLIRAFPDTEILVWMGAVMAVYGIIFATMENDIRRLLSYHIISQVGYMVTGIGLGTDLALNGSSSLAFMNILYKGLLLMGAGAVIHMTGKRKLTELGGLYKTMPWTFLFFMIGAFSIAGLPLFSGFISKSMIMSAAAEDHRAVVWMMLTLASAGTFLSIALKLGYFAFLGKDAGIKTQEAPINMLVAMAIASFLCIFYGIFPSFHYNMLPFPMDYHPYTGEHITASLQISLLSAIGFFMLIKRAAPKPTISIDLDWFYRKGSRGFMWFARNPVVYAEEFMGRLYRTLGIVGTTRLARIGLAFDINIIDGAVNGIARMVLAWASSLRRIQSGQIQHYALMMVLGLFLILSMYIIF